MTEPLDWAAHMSLDMFPPEAGGYCEEQDLSWLDSLPASTAFKAVHARETWETIHEYCPKHIGGAT